MELEIQEKRENILLDRMEVRFIVKHPSAPTPNRESVREQLSKELQIPKERVIVDHMKSSYGLQHTTGYAKIYNKQETAMNTERKYHLIRNKLAQKEEKKKEEKKAEGGGDQRGVKREEKKAAPAAGSAEKKEAKKEEKKEVKKEDKKEEKKEKPA